MDRKPDLLDAANAAGYIGLDSADPASALRRYRRTGLLRGTRVGRHIYYLRSELDALLEKLTEGCGDSP